MFPIILICFIIFVVFLNSRKRQITKQEQEITEQFWARENKANATAAAVLTTFLILLFRKNC